MTLLSTHPRALLRVLAADFSRLFSAGVFNLSFAPYRMAATPDAFMSRVGTSWSVGSKTYQAAFVIAGGPGARKVDSTGGEPLVPVHRTGLRRHRHHPGDGGPAGRRIRSRCQNRGIAHR
jgi:hypothetical protein